MAAPIRAVMMLSWRIMRRACCALACMTRSLQARRMIRQESVITALIGAAMGIPLGIFLRRARHPGDVEVRRRAVAAGDRAGRVHHGGDRRGRARGDHPVPPSVAIDVLSALHYE